jgi:retinitis pigmentosa 9 protein
LPSVLFREQNLVVARETERDRGDIVEDKKRKRPEDIIPDLPENQKAREFLKNAPTKGLWLPLGAEVKVMQCFRCKAFGHRSGDRECPLREQGNVLLDSQRQVS